MGTTLNPAVSRASTNRWLWHVSVYIVALVSGALATMLVLTLVADGLTLLTIDQGWMILALVLVALAVARDITRRTPVPYLTGTQVPEWLRHMVPASVAALAYGLQLGAGFLTKYTYSGHMAFVVMLPLLTVGQGLIACAVFGIAKSAPIWASMTREAYATAEVRITYRMRSRRGGDTALRIMNVALATAIVSYLAPKMTGG